MERFFSLRFFAIGIAILFPLQFAIHSPRFLQISAEAPTLPVLTSTIKAPSSECLQCHDAGTGPPIDRASGHVVEVDYRMAQSQWGTSLREASLPSGFGSTIENDLLVDGRVECTTCHYTHQEVTDNRFRLKVAGNTTPLCIACHDMEGR